MLSAGTDRINIPAGTYTLTRAGIDEDANSTADIDILASVTLAGAGPASTTIKGGTGYNGRIIQVLAGTVTLNDVTLRDGFLPNGRAGAGLRTEPGSATTLNNVLVAVNTADDNAGGILNRGTMVLNGSAVNDNQTSNATQGGGGLFNDDNATLTLNDSKVLGNKAVVVQQNLANTQGGGGIFNDLGATLTLNNTTVDSNVADDPGGIPQVLTDGGGIFSKGDLSLIQSTVSNNVSRGNSAGGGGIKCYAVTLVDHSLITCNTAEKDPDIFDDVTKGGGISADTAQLTITNSIISNNTSDNGSGGGLHLQAGTATIINTTISGNRASGSVSSAGGILAGSPLTLVDSTLSGNQADADAGGIRVSDSPVSLFNVTIANNTANADGVGGGTGGGLFFAIGFGGTITMRNSVVAGNLENGIGDHDDCDGSITSAGNNLVQNISGCSVTGGGGSDLLGVAANLGPFAGNGGPVVGASTSPIVAGMGTHLPASNSPLIDHGNAAGCKDQNNVIINADQRGFLRPVDGPDPDSVSVCDIGAVEFGSVIDLIFADNFE